MGLGSQAPCATVMYATQSSSSLVSAVSSLPVLEVSPPYKRKLDSWPLARQPEIGMPLVSSLATGEIAGEGSTSKGIGHGGGSKTWRGATLAEKNREKTCRM